MRFEDLWLRLRPPDKLDESFLQMLIARLLNGFARLRLKLHLLPGAFFELLIGTLALGPKTPTYR